MRTGQIEAIVFRTINNQRDYLALKRNQQKGGYWQPVTDGIEEGETLDEALTRELEEELLLTNVKIIDLNYTFEFTENGRTLKEHVFGVDLGSHDVFTLSKEHTEYKWLPYKEMHEILFWDSNKDALDILEHFLDR